MRNGIYLCSGGDKWNPRHIKISVKVTEKSYVMTLIEDKTRYPDSHIEMLFKKQNRAVVPKKAVGAYGHPVLDYERFFIIYPFRAGIPFCFDYQDDDLKEEAIS